MSEHSDRMRIDASPTKEFFIFMLTRDIQLPAAVIDLVDNSVDGALRARPNRDYDGLWVRLEAESDHFRIADNCGGISVTLARKYAFHFGRPADAPSLPHSVGQFGVGMKRALFKLGKRFKIESTTRESRFVVEVDVDKWRSNPDWEFEFSDLREGVSNPANRQGTIITVSPLLESVAKDFSSEAFQNELADAIGERHQSNVQNHLAITLNRVPVDVEPARLLSSQALKPAFKEIDIPEQVNRPKIGIKIFTGVAESEPRLAGWYVFCNGRMVLRADQSLATGWGETVDTTIPKYHPQFARFRGYAFFDCDDGGFLPWNTTKTGVDEDSPIFRSVREQMVTLMRPVITFLNKLDAEEDSGGPLSSAVDKAKRLKLEDVSAQNSFQSPKPEAPKAPSTARIQYDKPLTEVNKVKKLLKVSTYTAVGEGTFDYFLKMEGQ